MHAHYPIKLLNTWHLGSTVRYFSNPNSLSQLVDVYEAYRHIPTIWLGQGSNILFPDHELSSHIIKTNQSLNQINFDDGIYVEAGVALAKIARYCVRQGYDDAAFMIGIPGSLGGALMTNAGAYQHEIWNHVTSIRVLTTEGVKTLTPKHFFITYRQIQPPVGFIAFLSAKLKFNDGSEEKGREKMRTYLLMRNQAQPIGSLNCGSVFKNPKGRSAGRLIDDLGLRGYSIGGARISPVHGNFIENVSNSTSNDVVKLISLMRRSVWNQYHIRLNLEVKTYGL
jgi:UDP-N-acetylmuramate dehydrogenase